MGGRSGDVEVCGVTCICLGKRHHYYEIMSTASSAIGKR